MIRITNASKSGLGLVDGICLAPGQFADIEAERIAGNHIVQTWIAKGVLLLDQSLEPEYIEAQSLDQETPELIATNAAAMVEQDEKDQLIAALKERGIHRDRRSGIETLQALLADQ